MYILISALSCMLMTLYTCINTQTSKKVNFNINNNIIEQVDHFNYLGVILNQ